MVFGRNVLGIRNLSLCIVCCQQKGILHKESQKSRKYIEHLLIPGWTHRCWLNSGKW